MNKRHWGILLVSLLLSACATVRDTPLPAACTTACAPCPKCPGVESVAPSLPPAKPLQPARWEDLPGWGEDDLTAAWPAFLQSCRALMGRPQSIAWRPACELAKKVDGKDRSALRRFFESQFSPWMATQPDGSSSGMVTGYYEPLLSGSRTRGGSFQSPILAAPKDLLTIELGELFPDLKDKRVRGRLVGNKVVPYWSRADIVRRETEYPALFWVEDPVELFFLQVQGSGRIRMPDGEMMRVNYADQNGHPYQSIGRLLVERGELKLDQASMQGIQAWARANPKKLDDLLNANPSYVFFRETPLKNGAVEEGPPGALGVPLVPERSIAIDPRNIPLGAPVFLATTRPNSDEPLRRLVMAQDTGGAIKGVVRADFFWGFGAEAGAQAGRMRQSGQLWVLLPPGLAPK